MQLRYSGVLETTRVRRDGFAIRMPFEQFLHRLVIFPLLSFIAYLIVSLITR